MSHEIVLFVALLTMIATVKLTAADPPLACNLNALSPQERAHHQQLSQRLLQSVTHKRPLRNGYLLTLKNISPLDAGDWIGAEQKCCPFLRFELTAGPPAEPTVLQLRLTGPNGTRAFLEHELRLTPQ